MDETAASAASAASAPGSVEDWLRRISAARVAFVTQEASVQDKMMGLMWVHYNARTPTRADTHATMRKLYALENSLSGVRAEWVQRAREFRVFKDDLEMQYALEDHDHDLGMQYALEDHDHDLELQQHGPVQAGGGKATRPRKAPMPPFTVEAPLSRETRRMLRLLWAGLPSRRR